MKPIDLPKKLHRLRQAVRRGNILSFQDKLGYNPQQMQRMIADPCLLRQTMLDLEKELGPIGSIYLPSSKLPILALELVDALKDVDKHRIKKLARLLEIPSTVTQLLCRYVGFRNWAIRDLELKLDRWASKNPIVAASAFPRVPKAIEKYYFNKEEFIQGMAGEVFSLKAISLMSMPGGIRFLERMLDLPLTGHEDSFIKNYGDTYYIRRYRSPSTGKEEMTAKAAQYHDLEMLKHYDQDPFFNLTCAMLGAIKGGHMDLVKTYAPECSIFTMEVMLASAIEHGQLDMALYIHSLCKRILTTVNYENLLLSVRDVESYRLVCDLLPSPPQLGPMLYEVAYTSGCRELLDYINPNGDDLASVIEGAITGSNMAVFKRYVIQIPQPCTWDKRKIAELYGCAKNIKMSRMLYAAGLREPDMSVFRHTIDAGIDSNLEIFDFNLNVFDHIIKDYSDLIWLLGIAAGCPRLEVLEMILDHSWDEEKFDVRHALFEVIFSTAQRAMYDSDIRHLLVEILISRWGVDHNYALNWTWRYMSHNPRPMVETITSYMHRIGVRLTRAQYQDHLATMSKYGQDHHYSDFLHDLQDVTSTFNPIKQTKV